MLTVSLSLVPYSSTQPVIDTTRSRTPRYKFYFYQAIGNMLKMGMESVPETLENFHTLTWPSAWEHFIAVLNSASCTILIVIGEQVLALILHISGCRHIHEHTGRNWMHRNKRSHSRLCYVMLCSLVPTWANFCRTTWHHFLEELVVWRILANKNFGSNELCVMN